MFLSESLLHARVMNTEMLSKVTLARKTFATFVTLVFLTKRVVLYVALKVTSPLKLKATQNTLKFLYIRMHPGVLQHALLAHKSFPTFITLEVRGHLAFGVVDNLLGSSNRLGLLRCSVDDLL